MWNRKILSQNSRLRGIGIHALLYLLGYFLLRSGKPCGSLCRRLLPLLFRGPIDDHGLHVIPSYKMKGV